MRNFFKLQKTGQKKPIKSQNIEFNKIKILFFKFQLDIYQPLENSQLFHSACFFSKNTIRGRFFYLN